MSENTWSARPHVDSEQVEALREALKGSQDQKIQEFLKELDYVAGQHDRSEYAGTCDAFVAAAREKYVDEGDNAIAIDDDTVVSDSTEGAYVMAWVWVDNSEAGVNSEDEEEEPVEVI